MKFVVTNHAIARYQKRVEPCPKVDAEERLLHAASIATWATEKQRAVAGVGMTMALWCEVESLLMPVVRINTDWLILTVYRAPSDAECRRRQKQRRKDMRQSWESTHAP